MKKNVYIVLLTLLWMTPSVQAQSTLWNPLKASDLNAKSSDRRIEPLKYLAYALDVPEMRRQLAKAPMLGKEPLADQNIRLTLPMPDGSFQDFMIAEDPIMHPDLQAQFPAIRTYSGQGIDDPTAFIKCDFTLQGFHAMIRSGENSTVYIDPYAKDNLQHYVTYYRQDYQKNSLWSCLVNEDDGNRKTPIVKEDVAELLNGDCKKRTYRLAVAATGEYTAFQGGTVQLALSAIATTMNRVNGVFELDMAVRMNLIANNNLIVYTNASTDPYTNGDPNSMIGENATNLSAVIGNANFDIGHVFGTNSGGLASLRSVCTANKARGVTGSGAPVGDPFDIDYVAHEMGHQFGANHTQNNNCNRNNSTAMEPGSGSTIMGYAGICSPNIQPNSDDYFHAISLQEIYAFITGTTGNGCATVTNLNNAIPTANAGLDYVVPRSTPLLLSGTGTGSSSGNTITYCWEQMDNDVATMPPVSTNTGGPAFRSRKGTTSPTRYLPPLANVINNTSSTWDVLPSVARTMNFRLTVRDNVAGGGCSANDDMVVTVNGTAGPFLVTAPNTAVSWEGNTTQTVTWDVASTNAAPVSCANVDILMSIDGGNTYPYTLATATPNDGTQSITVPALASTVSTCRIMVRANGNIFYDISNVNFSVTPSTTVSPSVTIVSSALNNTACAGASVTFTANPTNGGTTPQYKWFINDVEVAGVTGNQLTRSNLANGNRISAQMTSSLSNASPQTATSNQITMTINPLPSTTIEYLDPNNTSVTVGSSRCPNQSTLLRATSGASSYLWNTMAATQSITVNPQGTTSYAVTITSGAGCTSVGSATISVIPPTVGTITPLDPQTNQSTSPNFCAGSSLILQAESGATYRWSNNQATRSITITSGGTYTVTVTQSTGCFSTASIVTSTVTGASIIANTSVTACTGPFVNFSARASGSGLTVSWERRGVGQTSFAPVVVRTVPPVAPDGTANLYLELTPADFGASYRAVFTSACGTSVATTPAVAIYQNNPELPTPSPATQTICTGRNAVLATQSGFSVVKWQIAPAVSSNRGSGIFTDIPNSGGLTSITLANLTQSSNVRAIIALGGCPQTATQAASVTVNTCIPTEGLLGSAVLSPNPVRDELTLSLSSSEDYPSAVGIFDMNGKMLFNQPFTVNKGENQMRIQTQSWSPGVYFVRLKDASGATQSLKFIKF